MKNFSDATAIKSQLKLDITLEIEIISVCDCSIKFNEELLHNGLISSPINYTTQLGLLDSIELMIDLKDRQHPQAVAIRKFAVDGQEILPLYQHLASPPTDYIDFSGSWALKIPNFYPWYHEITGQGWII
jgi:hypothetical protein